VSVVANGRVEGAPLPPVELLSYYLLLVVAGNETTRNAMTGGLLAFLENPGEWERLRQSPKLVVPAVEEIVRWTTPVIQFCRTATRDYELRGQMIRAGQSACLFYPSGNRDEEVFPDGDRFRIDRHPNDHVGFGRGEHVCLGAHLARLEIRCIFEELRERIDAAELPEEAEAQAERELQRLAALPPHAPDRHLIRTYLEWLADLPKEVAEQIAWKNGERLFAPK